jgi:hypothetical protein
MLKKLVIAIAFVSSCGPLHIDSAKADTLFSTVAPTPAKVADIISQKLSEFYKCSLIKRGPNFNPVKAGPTIFAVKAPAEDLTAIDRLDDKTVKIYRCELVEINKTNGRLKKIKDS